MRKGMKAETDSSPGAPTSKSGQGQPGGAKVSDAREMTHSELQCHLDKLDEGLTVELLEGGDATKEDS